MIALVVAMAQNGIIGADGHIPWRIPEDMRHFKAVTMGKPCIMGRKTWDSLPKKPLPGRDNIVVTRDRLFQAEGAATALSPGEAITRAKAQNAGEIMVIGGAEIYHAALPQAERIHLTEVHEDFPGDAHFVFDRDSWRETAREAHVTSDGLPYSFVTLDRR
jgi:dihydrofolate reductase